MSSASLASFSVFTDLVLRMMLASTVRQVTVTVPVTQRLVLVLVTLVIVDRETISGHCQIKEAHLAIVVKIILIVMIASIVIRNFGERITQITPTINITTEVAMGLISTIDSRIILQHFQQWLA